LRKALIAGFFDYVEASVRQEFGALVDRGDVVIVGLGRVDPRRGLNMELFKRAVGQLLTTECADVLVVVGASATWVEDSARTVLSPYGDRCRIDFQALEDLRDARPVLALISNYGIRNEPSNSDTDALMGQLAGQRVYCVRSVSQTSFERTLQRLGFVFDPLCFEEEVVESSRNSNLIQSLSSKSDRFHWLLYAWSGLRTLPSDAKKKFRSGCLEADSPMKVGTMFKQRLLKRAAK
jgi:hypothetical protein